MTKKMRVLSLILRLAAAVVLLQTLFFKFSAAPESVYIFRTLGMEPWGRIGTGLAELVAVALLLIPATVAWGALLSLGLMLGAIGGHLTRLGIVVQDDGGLLFGLAVFVAAAAVSLLALHGRSLPGLRAAFGAPRG